MRKRKTAIVKRVTTRSITNITPKFTSSSTDLLDNDQETYRMERQEWLQRQVDNFWGLDKDLKDRNQELALMNKEDILSQRVERDIKIFAQHRTWDYEFIMEEKSRLKREKDRKAYQRVDHLRLINSPLSVEELLHAIWNIDKGNESLPLMPQIASLSFADVTTTNANRSTANPLQSDGGGGGVDGLQDAIAKMGSMRMSLHLEGLQKTREIVEQAKGSFKAVLKDLHHHPHTTDTRKEQGQKSSQLLTKTSSLAEGSTGTFALVQQASVALGLTEAPPNPSSTSHPPPPPIDNIPRYNHDLEGHIDFHWDQEHILHRAFLLLDRGAKGFLTEADLQLLASDTKVRDLLQFTVYGAVIKRKEWSFFLELLKQDFKSLHQQQDDVPHMLALLRTPSNSSLMIMQRGMGNKSQSFRSVVSNSSGGSSRQPSRSNLYSSSNTKNNNSNKEREAREEGGLTYKSWFEGAISLSREQNVFLKHIRTAAEHTAHCTKTNNHHAPPNNNNSNIQQLQQQSHMEGEIARPFRVMRELHVGDTIWALHHNGTRWLPAVIEAIHNTTELTNSMSPVKAIKNRAKQSAAVSNAVYDLWYPLSDQELFRSRLATTSRQLLSLPSTSQPTPILPLALLNLYNNSSLASSNLLTSSFSAQQQQQQQLPVKPLAHEREVCAYAFDLLDSGATGVVELQALTAALQSPAMASVVDTSLVLQALFRGDTSISATNNNSTFMQSSTTNNYYSSPIYVGSTRSDRSKNNRNSKTDKMASSSPTKANRKWWQIQAARLLQGKEKRKLPTLLSVFYDTFNDAHEEEEKERKKKQDDDEVALGDGLLDDAMDTSTKQQQDEVDVIAEDNKPLGPPACISKMDFLEFCDCVQEICRFDLANLYEQNVSMVQ